MPHCWPPLLLRSTRLAEQLVHLVLQHPLVVQKLLHQRDIKLWQLPACKNKAASSRGEDAPTHRQAAAAGGGGTYLTAYAETCWPAMLLLLLLAGSTSWPCSWAARRCALAIVSEGPVSSRSRHCPACLLQGVDVLLASSQRRASAAAPAVAPGLLQLASALLLDA